MHSYSRNVGTNVEIHSVPAESVLVKQTSHVKPQHVSATQVCTAALTALPCNLPVRSEAAISACGGELLLSVYQVPPCSLLEI